MTEFLIGADPELFVRDASNNLVSAYGMIPGTKAHPYKVEGGAVQVDGMALEFNIDPASTAKQFNENITMVLKQLQEMIPSGYTFDFSPVAHFGKEYIDAQPDEAKELGCDPDFNAYLNGAINPKPDASQGFRTASGHIHIGWTLNQDINDQDHLDACMMVSKQLDIGVGLASYIWDRDIIRSKMYGQMGTFRPKHYGVEYRTMSNVWVKDEGTRNAVFELAMKSVQMLLEGTRFYDKYNASEYNYYHQRGNYSDMMYCVRDILSRTMDMRNSNPIIKTLSRVYDELSGNPFASAKTTTKKFTLGGLTYDIPIAMPMAVNAAPVAEFYDDGVPVPDHDEEF